MKDWTNNTTQSVELRENSVIDIVRETAVENGETKEKLSRKTMDVSEVKTVYTEEVESIGEDSKHDDGGVDDGVDGGVDDGVDDGVGQSTISNNNVVKNFFYIEVNKFREERKKNFWKDMTIEGITLDFSKLLNEWRTFGKNWRLQTKVKDGQMCSELLLRIIIGFLFTVLPNCMIVLDYTAAYQYLNGTDYPKLASNLNGN